MGAEHQYLICREEEGAMPLLDFLRANHIEVTDRFVPPGSSEEKLFSSHGIRKIFRRQCKSIYGLHKHCGKTLDENFNLDNIWVTAQFEIKFKDISLRNATNSAINYTYNRLWKLIRQQIFSKEVPVDIENWLFLLGSNDASTMEYCIRCHPDIMADMNRLEFFIRAYKHLWPIKALRRKAYDHILDGLPYKDNWPAEVMKNYFLSKVYFYEDRSGKRVEYEDGIPGLIQFLKNCDSHLHEKAVDPNSSQLLFSTSDIVPIICANLPLFIGALAENLHRKIYTENLHSSSRGFDSTLKYANQLRI